MDTQKPPVSPINTIHGSQRGKRGCAVVNVFILPIDGGRKSFPSNVLPVVGRPSRVAAGSNGLTSSGTWTHTTMDVVEGAILMIHAVKTVNRAQRSNCCKLVQLRSTGPLIQIEAEMNHDTDMLHQERLPSFTGRGDILTGAQAKELGANITTKELTYFHEEEEVEEAFTVTVIAAPTKSEPKTVKVVNSQGQTRSIRTEGRRVRRVRRRT